MILDLLPLESTALLKPSFAAYNSHIDRAILCCTPCTSNLTSWIAKQVQIPSDSYLQEDSKNMIRSILNLSKVMWDLGYACDGLDDPQSFIMMDSNVKLLPFGIRKRQNSDSEMMHRIKFSNLLENHLSQRWNDIEVNEFIKLMRNPSASLEHLLNHPLLLPPEIRMSSYLNLWIENLTPDQHNLYNSITSYGKWTSTIKSSQEVLHSILTYKEKVPNNKTIMYVDTARDAHRFSRNTASHYISHWRRLIPSSNRTKAPFDMVDKELKKCFPGLLCKIYAMTLDPLWNKWLRCEEFSSICKSNFYSGKWSFSPNVAFLWLSISPAIFCTQSRMKMYVLNPEWKCMSSCSIENM